MKEQIDARPVSNNDDMRYYERKQVNTLPHSFRYKTVNSQPISKGRVKFEPKIERPVMTNGYEKSPKEVPQRKKEYYQQTSCSATSDSEYESILECQYIDEDSEHESLFDHNDYSRTLTEMESKMNATTNQYFRKIKSTLSDTCSKLKFQQKQKPVKSKNSNDKAAGDFKGTQEHPENDHVIERILKMKSDCYKKIDQNLKILQQIDDVNDKLYKNYISKN